MKRISVVIASYNHAAYILETLESVLAQTAPAHEIIVVDDGSTDDTVARVRSRWPEGGPVTLLTQANGGQLAAWITGVRHARGELVALLDSDDLWQPGYLAAMQDLWQRHPALGHAYCNMEKFGEKGGLLLRKRRDRSSRHLGSSVLNGAFGGRWQGTATSGNVLERALLLRIVDLPAELVSAWKTRPDDCLALGSDILGAVKHYLAEPLARHREHPANALKTYGRDPLKELHYQMARLRTLDHYRSLRGIDREWLRLARAEFMTKPAPLGSDLWRYAMFCLRSPMDLKRKPGHVLAMVRHWLRARG
jgi:glycosyltransferase involved in cell wall biosynthesis